MNHVELLSLGHSVSYQAHQLSIKTIFAFISIFYIHSLTTHIFVFPGVFNSLFSLFKSSLKMDIGRGGYISYMFPEVNLDFLLEMAERSPYGNLEIVKRDYGKIVEYLKAPLNKY